MKLRKIDVLLAEHKPLSVEEGNVKKLGRYYYEVECPFCGKKNLVFFRNFWKGTRCKNKDCRAMFDRCNSVAWRDMVPVNEARA